MAQGSPKSTVITSLILIALCFAVGYFLTKPQWDKYTQLGTQLNEASTTNASLNDSLSRLQSFVDEFNTRSKDAQVAGLALPVENSAMPDLVASIGSLAKASGVALANMQLTPSLNNSTERATPNTIQVQEINFSAAGSYPSLRDFVLRLENHLRIVDLQHVNLKADESGMLQYQIMLKTYYQK